MKETIGIKRPHAPNYDKNYIIVPRWLSVMYNTIFFSTCILHPNSKKNDSDHFCIDCLLPLCFNCLPSHVCHKHIKIRRYIYSDVINRQDLCKLFNCSGIQTYHTNKAKVVFLKQRRKQQQQQQNSSKEYRCIICHRSLQDNSRYCSIACKVSAIYGDDRKRRIAYKDKDGDLKYCFQEGTDHEEYLANLPFPKRHKLRRKGVPLRSPLF
ncbi:hypothetical protein L484_004432 [Morus notabilis]|uniref:B box-type domain-containing protein n=1 Tax=Morus notabilis TaxID=981085 RepID=W9RXF1_9ROSA|nr:uncharacterized protein LOC21387934 [Morus notabilis]EXC16421.1 hypothetical protein L484_004432 [Morus notabilis]